MIYRPCRPRGILGRRRRRHFAKFVLSFCFQCPTSIRYSPGLGCCAPDFGNGAWGSAAALYGAVYAILGLGLPAVLVTVCNLRVLGIARYHRHRIASAIYEVTLSAQVTITHQRNPFFVPTVTAPSAGGPPRFHSAASTVSTSKFTNYIQESTADVKPNYDLCRPKSPESYAQRLIGIVISD